jgi:hypothetical protein
MLLYWDLNVFAEQLVQEWVYETKQAMLFYLGDAEALAKM